ncbi:unnamed protein product, partial [Urochloa humidicola]
SPPQTPSPSPPSSSPRGSRSSGDRSSRVRGGSSAEALARALLRRWRRMVGARGSATPRAAAAAPLSPARARRPWLPLRHAGGGPAREEKQLRRPTTSIGGEGAPSSRCNSGRPRRSTFPVVEDGWQAAARAARRAPYPGGRAVFLDSRGRRISRVGGAARGSHRGGRAAGLLSACACCFPRRRAAEPRRHPPLLFTADGEIRSARGTVVAPRSTSAPPRKRARARPKAEVEAAAIVAGAPSRLDLEAGPRRHPPVPLRPPSPSPPVPPLVPPQIIPTARSRGCRAEEER